MKNETNSFSENDEKLMNRYSSTFSRATELLPPKIRQNTHDFYNFVRTADEFVDNNHPQPQLVHDFYQATVESINGYPVGDSTVDNFAKLARESKIEPSLINAFVTATANDAKANRYQTYEDLRREFLYGVAGVIGLMLSRIWGIPQSADVYAEHLGYSYQLANVIRDIGEDHELGKVYIPQEEIQRSGLPDLGPQFANTKEFAELIRFQIERQRQVASFAAKGLSSLPKDVQPPVKIASSL